MQLESGPAKADRNWQLVRAALFLAFASWFVWDGAVGYANKNRKAAETILSAPEPFGGEVAFDELGETPTKPLFEALQMQNPTTRDQVHEALGEPVRTSTEGVGVARELFASRYGYGSVTLNRGRVESMNWITWDKSKEQIRAQFYFAIPWVLLGLYFLRKLYKAVTLHVTIDDEGMIYAGRRVTFENMVSLRDYSPKGWIDLYHKVGERESKLRLDNEKVALFDEIVAAICETKGFKNEVTAYADAKAREEE